MLEPCTIFQVCEKRPAESGHGVSVILIFPCRPILTIVSKVSTWQGKSTHEWDLCTHPTYHLVDGRSQDIYGRILCITSGTTGRHLGYGNYLNVLSNVCMNLVNKIKSATS